MWARNANYISPVYIRYVKILGSRGRRISSYSPELIRAGRIDSYGVEPISAEPNSAGGRIDPGGSNQFGTASDRFGRLESVRGVVESVRVRISSRRRRIDSSPDQFERRQIDSSPDQFEAASNQCGSNRFEAASNRFAPGSVRAASNRVEPGSVRGGVESVRHRARFGSARMRKYCNCVTTRVAGLPTRFIHMTRECIAVIRSRSAQETGHVGVARVCVEVCVGG